MSEQAINTRYTSAPQSRDVRVVALVFLVYIATAGRGLNGGCSFPNLGVVSLNDCHVIYVVNKARVCECCVCLPVDTNCGWNVRLYLCVFPVR